MSVHHIVGLVLIVGVLLCAVRHALTAPNRAPGLDSGSLGEEVEAWLKERAS